MQRHQGCLQREERARGTLTVVAQLELGIGDRHRAQPGIALVIRELQEQLVERGLRDTPQQVRHLDPALGEENRGLLMQSLRHHPQGLRFAWHSPLHPSVTPVSPSSNWRGDSGSAGSPSWRNQDNQLLHVPEGICVRAGRRSPELPGCNVDTQRCLPFKIARADSA